MKRARVLAIVALILVAGIVFWGFRRTSRQEGLVLAGTIEARDVEVGSLLGGRVSAVHVDEGATVTKGQPIVTFETDLIDLQVQQQKARLAETEAALALALAGPRQEERDRARVEWEEAERERRRLGALRQEGIVSRQDYDAAAAKAEAAHQSYLQLARGSRPEDIAAARASVERERQQLRYLERQREETVVTAPASGTIESIDLRPGDLVGANRPVARILEPGQLWVRVYVPEPKVGLVRLGQEASVGVDSFPRRAFHGHVAEIADRAEYTPRNVQTLEQRNEQVFGVKVEVDPAPELKPGMAATVRLPGVGG
jgi:multidrug resistance efflux pump